ncbi:MAG: hypothetical protein ACK5MB_13490 [Phycisphaerales bacterium]|jgi:hypothetical protein
MVTEPKRYLVMEGVGRKTYTRHEAITVAKRFTSDHGKPHSVYALIGTAERGEAPVVFRDVQVEDGVWAGKREVGE